MKVNILIDQDGHARLADFGLAIIVSESTSLSTSTSASVRGTIEWMSPELLHPGRFGHNHCRPTKESDCYALGMVIYEVLTGQTPFAGFGGHIVMRIVPDGERPGRPDGVNGTWFTDELWETLGMCWATDAQSRPNIEVVHERLEHVSGTWKPLPPQADEGPKENENDLDLTALMVWNLV